MKIKNNIFAFVAFLSLVAFFVIIGAYEQDKINIGKCIVLSLINFAVGLISSKKAGLMEYE